MGSCSVRSAGSLAMCGRMRSFPLATTTFLREQQDITDSEAMVLVSGRTTERRCSSRQQPNDDLSGRGLHLTRWAVP